MQNKEIINKCKEVGSLLDSYNISSSFSILEKIAKDKNNFSLSDRLLRVKNTYRYMAEYMLNGNADDSRESVYAGIIEQLRSISDSIIRDEISIDSSDAYSETFRMDKLLNQNIDSLISDYGSAYSEFTLASAAGNDTSEISRRLEDLHSAIFNKIWVSLNDKHTIQSALDAVLSMNYGERLGAHVISALTLSLLGFFDIYKLSALISTEVGTHMAATRREAFHKCRAHLGCKCTKFVHTHAFDVGRTVDSAQIYIFHFRSMICFMNCHVLI